MCLRHCLIRTAGGGVCYLVSIIIQKVGKEVKSLCSDPSGQAVVYCVFEVAGGSSVGLLMEVGGICTANGVCCG